MKMLPTAFNGSMASVFGSDTSDDDLSHGISVGYPILRIKGKVWSITRGGGDPVILMRPNNDGPRNSVEVVILAASQYVSKMWYEHQYEEGSTSPPDCFSTNSITPDASATNKQNNTCADCPQNKWGSKITPAGKKAKACGDSKRIAVSPLGDIKNEAFGGPMLLRVPAASLAGLKEYGDAMKGQGWKYFAVGTKISFEPTEAYPRLVFEPIRPLSVEEGMAVMELRKSDVVKAILAEGTDHIQQAHVEATVTLPSSFPQTADNVTPKVTQPPPPPSPVNKPAAAKKEKTKSTPLPVQPSPVDGFGSPTSAGRTPVMQKPQAAAPPPPPPTPSGPTEGVAAAGDFEAALDAQLDELEDLMPNE